jgi:hypothetical protein
VLPQLAAEKEEIMQAVLAVVVVAVVVLVALVVVVVIVELVLKAAMVPEVWVLLVVEVDVVEMERHRVAQVLVFHMEVLELQSTPQ